MALRIIWYSTVPACGVGYGVATKNIVPRIIADGLVLYLDAANIKSFKMGFWHQPINQ